MAQVKIIFKNSSMESVLDGITSKNFKLTVRHISTDDISIEFEDLAQVDDITPIVNTLDEVGANEDAGYILLEDSDSEDEPNIDEWNKEPLEDSDSEDENEVIRNLIERPMVNTSRKSITDIPEESEAEEEDESDYEDTSDDDASDDEEEEEPERVKVYFTGEMRSAWLNAFSKIKIYEEPDEATEMNVEEYVNYMWKETFCKEVEESRSKIEAYTKAAQKMFSVDDVKEEEFEFDIPEDVEIASDDEDGIAYDIEIEAEYEQALYNAEDCYDESEALANYNEAKRMKNFEVGRIKKQYAMEEALKTDEEKAKELQREEAMRVRMEKFKARCAAQSDTDDEPEVKPEVKPEIVSTIVRDPEEQERWELVIKEMGELAYDTEGEMLPHYKNLRCPNPSEGLPWVPPHTFLPLTEEDHARMDKRDADMKERCRVRAEKKKAKKAAGKAEVPVKETKKTKKTKETKKEEPWWVTARKASN